MRWLKGLWRRLFPVRQGLTKEQTAQFEQALRELAAVDDKRLHIYVREKIRVLQGERQRLLRTVRWYARYGADRSVAVEALEFQGEDPILWRSASGEPLVDAMVDVVGP